MGKRVPSSGLATTVSEYSSAATIHGVSYATSKDVPCIDRLVWLCLVIAGLSYAFFMSVQSYSSWMDSPVITTLEDTATPIADLDYPAVTVCAEGLNMLAVEKVLQQQLKTWKENRRRKRNTDMLDL